MNVEECLEKGQLIKIAPDLAKARFSLDTAQHKLDLAYKEKEHEIWEGAILNGYTAMFHAARSLLFKDGYKERSHYAVCTYIKEKYKERLEKKFLTEFDSLRLQRHEVLYALERNSEADEQEADEAIEVAAGFLQAVEKIIKETELKK